MATITITIEDIGLGKVRTVSEPSFEDMIKLHAAKEGLRPSHGYALSALNAILEASKTGEPFKMIVKKHGK